MSRAWVFGLRAKKSDRSTDFSESWYVAENVVDYSHDPQHVSESVPGAQSYGNQKSQEEYDHAQLGHLAVP